MTEIVLATHNCRWQHTSFGLRCLRANLGALRERSTILEFELGDRATDVVERLLAERPRIVGLGVYLWNAVQALQVVRTLKQVAPGVVVVIGGPEVSHESERQEICALADHVVRGEGDVAFRELCEALLAGRSAPQTIDAPPPHFDALRLPYDEYTELDVAERLVYVESSRGCPFTCEFCLSALEVPVRKAPLDAFLAAMQRLLDRGVRHFKFVDRTFNLGMKEATAILRFFRERHVEGLFLHFELIPDRLPDVLRDEIAAMPPGSLQFEIGVQTLDDATSRRIARRQDEAALERNLRWLVEHTDAHLHVDLIVGLPGEDEATFARGFDRLWVMRPHEIQVGVLKRLNGAPIRRHDDSGMRYAAEPPYEVLQSDAVPFQTMQRMKRFARYWDLVANRGNWPNTLRLVLQGESAYGAFSAFAEWLYGASKRTAGIALRRLAELLWRWLVQERGGAAAAVAAAMHADYLRAGRDDWPAELSPFVPARPQRGSARGAQTVATSRQARHRGHADSD